MRKHFLLLFLMALLPLAGFATDITPLLVGFGAQTRTYSAAEQNLPTPATIGGVDIDPTKIVDLAWYKGSISGEAITPVAGVFKFTDAGTYVCQFRINAEGYEGLATGTFNVAKYTLTVTAKSFNDALTQLTYGDEAPTSEYDVTYSNWPEAIENIADAEERAATKAALEASFGDPDYETTYTKGMPVNNYALTPVVTDRLTSNNYDFNPVAGTIKVVAKSFNAEGVNITATVADMTYNGADRKPVPTVIDEDLNTTLNYHVTTPAILPDDYSLKYYTSLAEAESATGTEAAADELTNVNTYYVKILGAGNYTGSIIKAYKVNQKSLWITSQDNETDYTGAAIDDYRTDLATYALFEGLVDGDANANGTPKATTYKGYGTEGVASIKINMKKGTTTYDGSDATKRPIDAGDYSVIFKPSTTDKTALFTNYKVVFIESGKHTINKVDLTVTVRTDLSMNLGETTDLEAGYTPTDATDALNYISDIDGLVAGQKFTTYPKLKLGAVKEDGTYPIDVDFTSAVIKNAGATTTIAKSNYNLKFVAGVFTINKGQMAVRPVNKTQVYGAEQTALTVMATGGDVDDNASVEQFLKDALVISEKGLPFNPDGTIKTDATEEQKVTYPAAGQYNISFDLTKVDETTLNEWKAKYDLEYFDASTYTINKAPLTITLFAQSLNAGDKANADATHQGLIVDSKTIKIEGLVNGEKEADLYEDIVFKFTGVVTGATYIDGGVLKNDAAAYQATLTSPAGYFAEAITLDDATVFENYKWAAADVVKGDLFVSLAAVLALDEKEVTNPAAVPAATVSAKDRLITADTKKQDVAIKLYRKQTISTKTYSWNAQQFNALVLPFDVTVAELSEQFGYAIVNVVNPSKTTEGNIYWSLAWGTIDANTPFVVRTLNNVDGENGTTIEFEDKTIVYDAEPTVDAGMGYKVVGTYSPVVIDNTSAGKKRFFGDNKDHGISATSTLTWTIVPFDAYLDYTEATSTRDVTLTFEDLNGGTTSISAAQFNNKAVNAEGWYTVNGVKLEGMPTEKGIYIQNGKKVVIK